MLHKSFQDVYNLFKMNFYESLCDNCIELSMSEAFALDIIHMLGNPTILEFANYMNISQPNATYKINQMIAKGYLLKRNSDDDKRMYTLHVTKKFLELYRKNATYIQEVLSEIETELNEEHIAQLEKIKIHVKEKTMMKKREEEEND